MRLFLSIPALLLFSTFLPGQCDPGELPFTVEIFTDEFAQETSWTIETLDGAVLAEGGPYSQEATLYSTDLCLPENTCLIFTILDEFGDGICCEYGDGQYRLYMNGDLIAQGGEFGYAEQTFITCPPGSVCSSAIAVEEGQHTTGSIEGSVWYEFVPDSNGIYQISTCELGNLCNTVIWVYDYCTGLNWNNTIEATIFFNDDYCGLQSSVSGVFSAGQTYYIRIGNVDGSCNQQFVFWSLEFMGPVVGCTDPTACNYNPLASIDDGTCLYPGDPDCGDGPDLILDESDFVNSLELDKINDVSSCMVAENCVTGYGVREIIRFTTHIENIGNMDFYIGPPPSDPNEPNDQWEWDECHGHWHYEGYAEYTVYDSVGTLIPIGFKNGFCVIDLDCSLGGGIPKYGCANQGISAGCGDIYISLIQCQWVDITDLPAGPYTLVNRVNWDLSPDVLGNYELDYSNNWVQACIIISRDSITNAASLEVLEDCNPYVDCAGEIYGPAQPDCTGECDGPRITGDLDENGLRTADDVLLYLQESLLDTMGVSACTDLNADSSLSVTDASLLLECILHEGSPPLPGHSHEPCEFPFGVTNPGDTVTLSIGNLDPVEQSFDVLIRNPYNRVAAFEFDLSGVEPFLVQPVVPDFVVDVYHEGSEIIGISFEEDLLDKQQEPIPLLRVYYLQSPDDSICIEHITAIVNDIREEVIPMIGDCLDTSPLSTDMPFRDDLPARVVPNPFRNTATLEFENPLQESLEVEIMDSQGQVVRRYREVLGGSLALDRAGLPGGVYWFRIRGKRVLSSGRFVVSQ